MTVQSIRPFVGIVEHLRRELAWGLAPVKPSRSVPGTPRSPIPSTPRTPRTPRSPRSVAASLHDYFSTEQHDLAFVQVLEPPALELANAVLEAMKTVEHLITVTFHQRSAGETPESAQSVSGSQKAAVREAERKLVVARDGTREVLAHVFDQVDMHQRAEGRPRPAHLPREIFDCSLAAIALLQVRPPGTCLSGSVARRIHVCAALGRPTFSLLADGARDGQGAARRRERRGAVRGVGDPPLVPPHLAPVARRAPWPVHLRRPQRARVRV